MIRRTPPSTPTTVEPNLINVDSPSKNEVESRVQATTLQTPKSYQSGSAPNLATIPTNEHVTLRKRKHDDENERVINDMQKLIDSHCKNYESHSTKTDASLNALHHMMTELLKQNSEIKESIAFVSNQYEDMRSKLDSLESEKKTDREYIHRLEGRIENLERMLYNRKLEIKNIPLSSNKSEEELSLIVMNMAKAVGAPLQRSEIKEVYSTSKENKPSKITVDLTSTLTRDDIVKKARQFNSNNKQNKLSSKHLNMDGPATPVYVSDFLPPQTQHLFYLARKFSKEHNYSYCWTSAGRVFLRKSEIEKPILIKREADLVKLTPKH